MLKFNHEGLQESLKGINRAMERYVDGARKGLEEVALDLAGESARNAPVDTGDLRGSGYATFNEHPIAQGRPDGSIDVVGSAPKTGPLTARVGFGVPYALKQDQDRTLNHPRGGKAGYLSDTVKEKSDHYLRHIENSVRREGR